MEVLEILKLAISQQKQISYEYEAPGRAIGVRIGNPHAIFISTANNVNIDIHKISGVKTDPSKLLPDWRQYTVLNIRNVVILENGFSIAKGYNPNSKQYSRVIAKI